MSKKIKTVIFDMDGVIFNTEKMYLDCCVEIGKNYDLTGVEEVCRKCIGITSTETEKILIDAYGEDFPLEKYRLEVYELFKKHFGDGKGAMKPGVTEILDFLKCNQYKIALASSTNSTDVKSELASAEILGFFDVVIGGEMVGKSKPEPDIFLKAAEVVGSEPSECLVIEDSHNGVRAAFNAGMKAIMVPDLLPVTEEMKEKATYIVKNLKEAMQIISEMA